MAIFLSFRGPEVSLRLQPDFVQLGLTGYTQGTAAHPGQRSIRLSRTYRAIYEVKRGTVEFVSVEEVTKHDY